MQLGWHFRVGGASEEIGCVYLEYSCVTRGCVGVGVGVCVGGVWGWGCGCVPCMWDMMMVSWAGGGGGWALLCSLYQV